MGVVADADRVLKAYSLITVSKRGNRLGSSTGAEADNQPRGDETEDAGPPRPMQA